MLCHVMLTVLLCYLMLCYVLFCYVMLCMCACVVCIYIYIYYIHTLIHIYIYIYTYMCIYIYIYIYIWGYFPYLASFAVMMLWVLLVQRSGKRCETSGDLPDQATSAAKVILPKRIHGSMSYIHQTYPNSTEFQSVKATNSYMISYNIIKYIYIYIYIPTIHKSQGSPTAGHFRWPCDPAIPCLRHTPRWAKERAGLEGSHIDHAICACQANFRLHQKPDKNSDPKKEL